MSADPTNLQINKRVTGTETLNLDGQAFSCFTIDWEYIDDPRFVDIQMTDWVSEQGLIKRVTVFGRTTLVPPEPEEGVTGNVQITEKLFLKDLKIK